MRTNSLTGKRNAFAREKERSSFLEGVTVQQLVDSCYTHKKESIELQKYNKSGSIKSIKKGWFKNLNKKNAYFDFIENCHLENSLGLKTLITQEHHIIPKHFLSSIADPKGA